jgi:hypothetical protein
MMRLVCKPYFSLTGTIRSYPLLLNELYLKDVPTPQHQAAMQIISALYSQSWIGYREQAYLVNWFIMARR